MPPSSFASALSNLVLRPWTMARLWNWKSAALSVILRVPVFLAASVRRGLAATVSATLTEFVFCAVSAGFYGAIAQSFRLAEPRWLTLPFLTLILPAFFQSLEYFLHWTGGTPHLRLAEIVSSSISALSALFNWYAMRRDALLVGPEGARFGSDLARLPRLLLNFLTAWPRNRRNRRKQTPSHRAE